MMMKKLQILKMFFIGFMSLAIYGCQTISPEKVADNIQVKLPDIGFWMPNNDDIVTNEKSYPVVFFLQGSGSSNIGPQEWGDFFIHNGVGYVNINSDTMRERKNLFGIPTSAHSIDVKLAMKIVKQHPAIDLSRYAIMGFSRGGTAALVANRDLDESDYQPNFVFAMYPGDHQGCRNTTRDQTETHVFYGSKDQWGLYSGAINLCRNMAKRHENTTFHLLENAHHGYDGSWSGKWNCCGGRTFSNVSDPDAKAITKEIILEAMQKRWNLD